MVQIRPLTSLSHDELIARIEQYVVVVELRDAEIRELHAANSALPRSWWRDAFNRIAAEGVTLDDLIDVETRRKLP